MFSKTLRVYYEDTDAGGIVYHSNYLNYMERCRSDWLLHLGYSVTDLQEQGTVFVVREVNLSFIQPAKLMDELTVTCQVLQVGKVKLELEQNIYNHDTLLCSAKVKLGSLQTQGLQIVRIPEALRAAFLRNTNQTSQQVN